MVHARGGDEPERTRRGAGELESEVLAALWSAPAPMTVAEVVGSLTERELAYTTVHTILARLVVKGLVMRERTGRVDRYLPTRAAAEVAAERMYAVLQAGTDRMAVLRTFVDRLSAADEQALRRVLNRRRTGGSP
jgi:predicted transcriptional regulator